jgi:hypothetical protein
MCLFQCCANVKYIPKKIGVFNATCSATVMLLRGHVNLPDVFGGTWETDYNTTLACSTN